MSILLKTNSIEVYDGTIQKNKINIFQENNMQNMNNVIQSIETIQNSISDIATIRAGAAKGATAVQSLSGYATTSWCNSTFQPKGNYLTSHQSLSNYYTKEDVNSLVGQRFPSGYVDHGQVFVGYLGAKSSDAIAVAFNFNHAFPAVPHVICCPYQSSLGNISGALSAVSYGASTTGAYIRAKSNDNPSAQNVYAHWIAIC